MVERYLKSDLVFRGNRCVKQNVSPLGEDGIGRNNGTATFGMPCRDDLIEQVGGLLIEGQIAKLVAKC